ncbi:Appr-1-p processing enzyme family protein [Tritrichomonas foetus]|uniref:Appr-1-p processing enzyme family protein n=1 Tax=Tritrichomonas foetus TaxID=1144522 RepID=A0A1J4J9A0_9EUKA|nr:Appr-1-p processing enzyme family protein [Tritrichomonas foetus]|eukprot:OHS95720.1 Appr-1-p processing enzyme family protein [Tritrichomonas foetus]
MSEEPVQNKTMANPTEEQPSKSEENNTEITSNTEIQNHSHENEEDENNDSLENLKERLQQNLANFLDDEEEEEEDYSSDNILLPQFAETQAENENESFTEHSITAESQPVQSSYFKKPILPSKNIRHQPTKSSAPASIPLSEIPTWLEMAPEILKKLAPPSPENILFEPNNEINQKITYFPRGDSTVLAVDAIVNAANSGLYAGGGICGAIHRAAGRELESACMKIGGCKTGGAVMTPGFKLPSKYVIHAVGPIGESPKELESAYKATLGFIDGKDVRSVALCCLSTGIYGYPIRPATKIALRVVREFLEDAENRKKTDRIIFVVFMEKDCRVYENFLHLYFPLEGEVEYNEKLVQKVESQPPPEAEPANPQTDNSETAGNENNNENDQNLCENNNENIQNTEKQNVQEETICSMDKYVEESKNRAVKNEIENEKEEREKEEANEEFTIEQD